MSAGQRLLHPEALMLNNTCKTQSINSINNKLHKTSAMFHLLAGTERTFKAKLRFLNLIFALIY